jgi:hypothetical protein
MVSDNDVSLGVATQVPGLPSGGAEGPFDFHAQGGGFGFISPDAAGTMNAVRG